VRIILVSMSGSFFFFMLCLLGGLCRVWLLFFLPGFFCNVLHSFIFSSCCLIHSFSWSSDEVSHAHALFLGFAVFSLASHEFAVWLNFFGGSIVHVYGILPTLCTEFLGGSASFFLLSLISCYSMHTLYTISNITLSLEVWYLCVCGCSMVKKIDLEFLISTIVNGRYASVI